MHFYGYARRLSSRPRHLTAPNGLNFSRSIHNPNSRLNKLRGYLSAKGAATKKEILRDVFGKTVGKNWQSGEVSYGWGAYLFSYGVHHGYLTKVRKGNTVYWSLR